MKHFLYGAFWIGIYIVLIMTPLFVLLIGQTPPGRGFWRELSVGLGFTSLSMIGMQFFLTGRFRSITAPYGIDVIYYFHRQISIVAFVFIVLHPLILLISSPRTMTLLNPIIAPWWATAGVAGLAAFAIVIITSLKRIPLGIRYETWRLSHALLSVAAVAFSMAHILGVGYYTQGPLKRGLWIGLALFWIIGLVYIRVVKPIIMLKHPYTVERVVRERGDTWSLILKPDGHEGMRFQPGQFVWAKIGKSPFALREHPFSFSSSAMREGVLEISIKELGDFTSQIGDVAPGTRVYLDGPHGLFTVDRYKTDGYVFIAAGVGITPIMSILRTLADRRDRRPLLLFYSSRGWEEVTFRDELETLKERLNLQTVHILTRESPEGWEGERGRINPEMLARYLPADRLDYEYFVCGPEPMQKAIRRDLGRLGLPLENVQSETFNFV
jgi:predicted ferric reductase